MGRSAAVATIALGLVACGGVGGALELPGADISVPAPAAPATSCPETPAAAGPLTVTPARYEFPATAAGQSSASKTFVVTNTADTRTGALTLALSSSMEFSIPGGGVTCKAFLEPGASCSVEIGFHPRTAGSRAASLTIVSASGARATACLSGTGS